MRTTLDLPDALLKRAKIEAVERGMTLKELVDSLRTDSRFARVDEPPRLEGTWRALARDLPRGRCADTDTTSPPSRSPAVTGWSPSIVVSVVIGDLDCLILE